ncbi:hypothetical protein AC578_1362 [Pseudocercospora eumusae]|uniref:Uncharacterized protein n=1 Tax=Pseudocercospora eumusae TaxID=321146 RepID=A0A139HUP3_9PEZI|nr:hypothetical protein AC578_1362 [Pseudocercospora eumusae]
MRNETGSHALGELKSHRDGFGRKEQFPIHQRSNWFFNYRDGRLKRMKIQRAEAFKDRTAFCYVSSRNCFHKQLFCPARLDGKVRNHDPVRYQHWGYPRAARNPKENANEDEIPLLPRDQGVGDIELANIPSHVLVLEHSESCVGGLCHYPAITVPSLTMLCGRQDR